MAKDKAPVPAAAPAEDKKRARDNRDKEEKAMRLCQEKIAAHKLDMKLVDVEYTFDLSKIIFYFTANGRIDFRELVKDLASIFKTRIELRQIGVRDEAKMIGGLGSCGRPICCRTFLGDFQPVSIKMAKEQNLLLNPTKISGLCGRLMCCLKYEQSNYEEAYRRVPRVGKEVLTPDGRGTVAEISVVREKVRVRYPGKDGAPEYREYDFDQVQAAPKEAQQAEKPRDEKPREDAPEAPAAAAEDELAPAAAELFDTLGRHSGFALRLVFANLWCFLPLLKRICTKSGGEMNALMRTTCCFTMMEGSRAANAIPTEARMTANLRLSPLDTMETAVERLRRVIGDPDVSVRTIQGTNPSPVSPTNTPEWERLRRAIRMTWPEAIVSPYMMVACSDSRHFCAISENVFRFSAMELSKEERGCIHGLNERVPTEKIGRAAEFFTRVLLSC